MGQNPQHSIISDSTNADKLAPDENVDAKEIVNKLQPLGILLTFQCWDQSAVKP